MVNVSLKQCQNFPNGKCIIETMSKYITDVMLRFPKYMIVPMIHFIQNNYFEKLFDARIWARKNVVENFRDLPLYKVAGDVACA